MKYISMAFFLFLTACDNSPSLSNPQDATAYLDPTTENQALLSPVQTQQFYHNFLMIYYSPWNNKIFDLEKTKNQLIEQINTFTQKPGWNENQQPHTVQWIENIVNNMDMSHFPNHVQTAIIVHASNARLLPTLIPSYSGVSKSGAFYPFDNIQDSYLAAGTPVRIIQETQDKTWDFVLTENNTSGDWIPAKDVANVNAEFIKQWQHNDGYITVKSDNISLLNHNHQYSYSTRMGEIYPVNKISPNFIEINIALKNTDGNAVIQTATINKNSTYTFPLITTPKNIATIANQFIGHPYGWGGMYGYRDCSSTTKDIFAYFGISLPRNSAMQKKLSGTDINLEHLSDTEKQKILLQKGIPFLSLVYMPGHIMIYLGDKDNTLYILHDMWGLKTFRPFQSTGRMIVGKTVITPITFGKEYWTVEKNLLSKATDLITLP